uniref:NADH-ubiquinone oxidoreductase chain 2 n=1 Tax=Plectrocnemia tsukuiensis TaxID=623670 RepID=A0A9E8LNL1_9NEOP|nr:NADH dehydrogenase subunit 2 [Plectrocnemia tsukuiensis]UZZ43688.1 NADH dehydrogenase subunit 2 [Plectrocnemia tsukuiensis]
MINNNLSNLMFILINIMSTMYAISTNCWINCFMAMEINLFFFIPLIFYPNTFNLELTMKYFIIQASSSIIMMMCILLYKNFISNLNTLLIIMMNFCILIKLGSAPFHYWYIEISSSISWKMLFLISTWQKITPMIILMYNFNFKLLTITIIMNSIISMAGGINQINMKKIMAFSSINHLSWMLASMKVSEMMLINYFLIYMTTMLILLINMNQFNITLISQLMMMKKKTFMISIFVYFMSLSGMPPLMGFIPKWMTINKLMENKLNMISIILMVSSLLNLYYYFKISYYSIMYKTMKISFNIKMKHKNILLMFNYLIMLNMGFLIMFTFFY